MSSYENTDGLYSYFEGFKEKSRLRRRLTYAAYLKKLNFKFELIRAGNTERRFFKVV